MAAWIHWLNNVYRAVDTYEKFGDYERSVGVALLTLNLSHFKDAMLVFYIRD